MRTDIPKGVHICYQQQYRKCGKATCGTCKSGPGHGPYFYAYWRDETGRLHSTYLGKDDPRSDARKAADDHKRELKQYGKVKAEAMV